MGVVFPVHFALTFRLLIFVLHSWLRLKRSCIFAPTETEATL